MGLHKNLLEAKTEEDVKDAYIKALGLKSYSKNLIDIQTKEVWFEAKDGHNNSAYKMFTQLLHYVQQALNKGETVPPLLCVIDIKKAAIMKTSDALPLLTNKNQPIKWGKSASGYTQEALDAVSAYIGTYFVSFNIETHESEFISTLKNAIKSGDIIRTHITPDNLKQVFDKWVLMIGNEIKSVSADDYVLLFYADIMSDGVNSTHTNLPAQLLHKGNMPVFMLNGNLYELGSREGYRRFWAIYHRPPREEYRNYLLERRDSLIHVDERSFKGAFYTPLNVVDKAYDKLSETLGVDWQKEYIVWDMCCGVGNLEVKHSNLRNVFMSTLDTEDINVMKATRTCVSATRFQYDYLNDDITDNGEIDYSITNKVPKSLQDAIKAGKKILVLINPPYAEAGNSANVSISSKGGETSTNETVAKTKFAKTSMRKYGKASNELFTQFVARIAKEIPNATLAMFSKMKYINAPNFTEFRNNWNAEYLGGFVVHSIAFDGLKGNFPIGFLIWKTNNTSVSNRIPITTVPTDVLNKEAVPIGEKVFYNIPVEQFLSFWINRDRTDGTVMVPLKNCISPASSSAKPNWHSNAIGYLVADANDVQQAGQGTLLLSGANGVGHKGGFFVTAENLQMASIVFTVRRIVRQTWLNDRDQFLQPNKPLNDEFKNDCLIWMLFNGSNLTAGASDLEWNGQLWSIVNHFIPFTEVELGSTDRFESDFMVRFMDGKIFSSESEAVLKSAKYLWQQYFTLTDVASVRESLKLNRPDVGWYQVRKALQARNKSGDYVPVSFDAFEESYEVLTEKLKPLIYEFGFLRS